MLRFDALEIRLHSRRALVLHLLQDVTVNVESKARRRVTEIRLHRLHVVALLERRHGVCMAQIVKARVGASYLRRSRFEAFERRLRKYEMPRLIRENEIPFVLPRLAHYGVAFKLFSSDLAQKLHYERRDGQNARFVVLRRRDIVTAALFLFSAQLLLYRDRTVAEVYGAKGGRKSPLWFSIYSDAENIFAAFFIFSSLSIISFVIVILGVLYFLSDSAAKRAILCSLTISSVNFLYFPDCISDS